MRARLGIRSVGGGHRCACVFAFLEKMKLENKGVTESEFISELKLHVYKTCAYPLELITFVPSVNGRKLIAIPSYCGDETLFIDDKDYGNYQTALTRVGAILDKIDYPSLVIDYRKAHPLSCEQFYEGYKAADDDVNPYEPDSVWFREWALGFENRENG